MLLRGGRRLGEAHREVDRSQLQPDPDRRHARAEVDLDPPVAVDVTVDRVGAAIGGDEDVARRRRCLERVLADQEIRHEERAIGGRTNVRDARSGRIAKHDPDAGLHRVATGRAGAEHPVAVEIAKGDAREVRPLLREPVPVEVHTGAQHHVRGEVVADGAPTVAEVIGVVGVLRRLFLVDGVRAGRQPLEAVGTGVGGDDGPLHGATAPVDTGQPDLDPAHARDTG
ncbi:MAG: hypothetical protein R2705_02100 [Ilumatobacteraceae bacterium]